MKKPLFILFLVSMTMLEYLPAYASGTESILHAMSGVADIFITIGYGFIILLFVISVVKSGVSAQIAMQIGGPKSVSKELIAVISAVLIFVVAMLLFPVVRNVLNLLILRFGPSNINGQNFEFPQ